MPHGNHNKKRTSAKKKGKNARRSESSSIGNSNDNSRDADGSDDRRRKPRSMDDLTRRLLYFRYKTTDQRIENALMSMVPPDVYQSKINGVNGIWKAADYIVEQTDLPVEAGFFHDLRQSIRDRRNMAVHEYRGGDDGHAYVIEVLEYCWARLNPRRTARIAASRPAKKADLNSLRNQFDGLSTERNNDTESDDDSDTDDEMDLPQGPRERPKEPTRLTVLELTSSSDHIHCIAFVTTLDELMGFTAKQYSNLAAVYAEVQKGNGSPQSLVGKLMEASVAANIAIQQVVALEKAFNDDHPHLNTLYRVLANLILVDYVQELTTLVTQKSPLASQFSERDAVAFLGDVMESSFRNKSDPNNRFDSLVPEFLQRWSFADDAPIVLNEGQESCVRHILDAVHVATQCEVAVKHERDDELIRSANAKGRHDHMWLPNKYIGRNRSITSTIRQVQRFSDMLQRGAIKMNKGRFGIGWGDRMEPATQIQGDMDELLMADIMPSLIMTVNTGYCAGETVPFEDELLSGFAQIKTFMKHPERPMSWALAFSIHTILTSIFEVQDFRHLAETAQGALDYYFAQVKWANKAQSASATKLSLYWENNVQCIFDLRRLSHISVERTKEEIMRGLWNPYCGGCYLLYIGYNGNLDIGTTLVDIKGMIHVLHLFNALKQVGALKENQIPVLDGLFDLFKRCQSIWDGPIPVKGRFNSCWEKVRKKQKMHPEGVPRIILEGLSKSFRRICRNDFHGILGRYSVRDRPKKRDPMYRHVVRVNDTLDAMMDDAYLLSTNWICMQAYLHKFYFVHLVKECDWMPTVETTLAYWRQAGTFDETEPGVTVEAIRCVIMLELFGGHAMKPLDSGDRKVASDCAASMLQFFNQVPVSKLQWFVPMGD